jgi:predicted amidophosphoribosyltransferase
VIERVLTFLYPPACAGCKRAEGALCAGCRPGPLATRHFVAGGVPAVALGPYEGRLRRAVLALKSGRRDLAPEFAWLLAGAAAELLVPGRVLVGVPTTRRRRSARGFDQGRVLAAELERCSGLPSLSLLSAAGKAQQGRSRGARLQARGRFACESASLAKGLEVLLVDDVVTTGATLRDCTAVLERAGARVEGALAIARAERVDHPWEQHESHLERNGPRRK